jgi:hypothetical protein
VADDPVEAREAPAWQPHDGPLRTRTWASRGPAVEVYTQGEWRPARLMQRQDRAYVWDPSSVRAVAPAAGEPTERRWP